MAISNLASVHKKAKIAPSAIIEAFSTIEEDVIIGENTWVAPNSVIMNGTRIGDRCRIFPSAVIGAVPQDLKFDNEYTEVFIGDDTTIREFVTINRATKDQYKTIVGKNCLIMAYVHIAHDCNIGDNCVIANSVNFAGHVILEDWVIVEGLVAIQQFIRIGSHTFLAGGSHIRKNIPPFIKAAREPVAFRGVNIVGLRRRGFDEKSIKEIESIYKTIFVRNNNISKGVKIVQETFSPSMYKDQIIQFILNSDKGILKGYVEK